MSNVNFDKHVAKIEDNQILVNAITDVLNNGPRCPGYASCFNVQEVVDDWTGYPGAGESLSYLAYSASERLAISLGLHGQYPVDTIYFRLTGEPWWDIRLMPHWEGYKGALRRQWLTDVREFVKNSEETFKD
jgi:hypothetical protein